MNSERKQKLLEHKIYVPRKKKGGIFLTLCQLRVIETRIKSANLHLQSYIEASYSDDAIQEHIYRYVSEDTEIKLCNQCKDKRTKFISIEYGWHNFCSNSCSSKHKAENGIGNAGKSGWKHTEETKRKMSNNHADFSGDKNPFKKKMETDIIFREEMIAKKIEYWAHLDLDRKAEISEIFSKAQSKVKVDNSNNSNSYGRGHKSGYYFSKKMNKQMFYRSSWELQVCEFLDKEDNNVIYFDIEPFAIEYKLEDGEKRYTRIDFHIVYSDGRQMIVEVKPSAFLEEGNVPFKIKGCKEYAELNNINFVVVTQKELRNLEEILA